MTLKCRQKKYHSDIKMRQVANQRLRLENQRLKAEMARKMNEMVSHADSTRNQGHIQLYFDFKWPDQILLVLEGQILISNDLAKGGESPNLSKSEQKEICSKTLWTSFASKIKNSKSKMTQKWNGKRSSILFLNQGFTCRLVRTA